MCLDDLPYVNLYFIYRTIFWVEQLNGFCVYRSVNQASYILSVVSGLPTELNDRLLETRLRFSTMKRMLDTNNALRVWNAVYQEDLSSQLPQVTVLQRMTYIFHFMILL